MAIVAGKQKINPISPGYIQEYIDDLEEQKNCLKYDLDQAIASLKQLWRLALAFYYSRQTSCE